MPSGLGVGVMVSTQWIEQHFPQLSNLQPLAKGGQKEVFSARHAVDGDVVLKLITPSSDGGERVRREILAVQQVKSARVPQVKEAGVLTSPEGRQLVWLREEKISGEPVRETVSRGPLQKDEVVRLGLHVLEALADAERARIVHRDVKPDNIIRGTDGQFWLLDFGIARFLDLTSLTATAFGGPATIGYAPPEQYRNHKREIDARRPLRSRRNDGGVPCRKERLPPRRTRRTRSRTAHREHAVDDRSNHRGQERSPWRLSPHVDATTPRLPSPVSSRGAQVAEGNRWAAVTTWTSTCMSVCGLSATAWCGAFFFGSA